MRLFFMINVFLFLLNPEIKAQSENSLKEVLAELKASVKEAESGSYTFEQSMDQKGVSPHKMVFRQKKTSKKGKSENYSFEFSLRDCDSRSIEVENKKDLLLVNLSAKNRQNFIKVFEDGQQQDYTSEIQIIADDIDNAREIKQQLYDAIKLAKELDSSCLPESFEAQISWLNQNISSFEINETSYGQTFKMNGIKSTNATLNRTIGSGKKLTEEVWKFNLADLNSREVEITIDDKDVFVEVGTNDKLKYIYYEKDGEQQNYTAELKFYMDELEEAKCLKSVLEAVIKACRNNIVKTPDVIEPLKYLSEKIKNIENQNESITQEIDASCITQLKMEPKKSDELVYVFNLADIESSSIEIDIKGRAVMVNLNSGKPKFIQSFENEKIDNYTNEISVYAASVENAEQLKSALIQSIKFCENEPIFSPPENVGQNLKWMKDHLNENAKMLEVEQYMELIDGNECKWQFKVVESEKDKETEEVFEFNLSDLDKSSIQLNISGKALFVEAKTRNKEKIIKYIKNGEPDDYQNSFLIRLGNLEDARKMIKVLQASIANCKN